MPSHAVDDCLTGGQVRFTVRVRGTATHGCNPPPYQAAQPEEALKLGMNEARRKAVLQAANDIRPELEELLGAEAPAVDAQLETLLAEPSTTADAALRIEKVLRDKGPTRGWLYKRLEVAGFLDPEKDFQQMPGPPTVSPLRYVCPRGDYDYFPARAGARIPLCPTHHVPLRPAEE
jgi:hypothetical protein